jgi:WS/DGAT/MGAT family acyltransferase
MSSRLTALDATFLELEEANESAHMHIGAIMVFDGLKSGGAPSPEQLCGHLADRLGQLPRYSQRLSEPHTGGLSWPEWQPDPAFDLARQVSRAALPEPGGRTELQDWASAFFSQRLDRLRPLWEMVIVEGLEDGRWALATKTHHCMVDGVGSVDVGNLILDTEPEPERARSRRGAGGPRMSGAKPGSVDEHEDTRGGPTDPLGRIVRAWSGLLPVDAIASAAQAGAHGVMHPREALRTATSALEMVAREEIRAAPHTSLNDPIGTQRRFEVVRVPLAAINAIRAELGGTVNDVVLAVVASGLKELLESRGEMPPEQGVRAMVPMNVRSASEKLALGNKISSLFIDLPVSEPDPVRRYRETAARSAALKSDGHSAEGTTAVLDIAGLAPPVIHSTIAQALYATRLFNVTITNVPGPEQPLYAFGCRMLEIQPLVPLAAAHAVGVAILSYDGDAFFGVIADRDGVPDLEVMVKAIGDAVVELGEAPGVREDAPAYIHRGSVPRGRG